MKRIIRYISNIIHDIAIIWANEMKLTVKDEGVLIFFIIVPLLYPLLYSWIYNNEVVREVPVAIIDKNHSHMSREYARMCDATPDVKIAYHCNNIQEAQHLIGLQEVKGIIVIPHDFDTKVNRGEQAHISVYCDMSLMLTYKAIFQTAQGIASKMNADIQIERGGKMTQRDDEILIRPINFDEVPMFNTTGGYGNAILPAVLIIIIQQTLLLGIGLSAGTAREKNRYFSIIPISRYYNGILRIITGKALCYAMIYAVIGAYLTLVVPRIFSFTTMASASALSGLMVPYILACIFFGMTTSCLIRYRENVILIIVFTSLLLLFMTGISWPASNIPPYWQSISWLFPSTFGVKGFLTISSMGGTLNDIQPECIALWIQVLAYFLLTCLVYTILMRRNGK